MRRNIAFLEANEIKLPASKEGLLQWFVKYKTTYEANRESLSAIEDRVFQNQIIYQALYLFGSVNVDDSQDAIDWLKKRAELNLKRIIKFQEKKSHSFSAEDYIYHSQINYLLIEQFKEFDKNSSEEITNLENNAKQYLEIIVARYKKLRPEAQLELGWRYEEKFQYLLETACTHPDIFLKNLHDRIENKKHDLSLIANKLEKLLRKANTAHLNEDFSQCLDTKTLDLIQYELFDLAHIEEDKGDELRDEDEKEFFSNLEGQINNENEDNKKIALEIDSNIFTEDHKSTLRTKSASNLDKINELNTKKIKETGNANNFASLKKIKNQLNRLEAIVNPDHLSDQQIKKIEIFFDQAKIKTDSLTVNKNGDSFYEEKFKKISERIHIAIDPNRFGIDRKIDLTEENLISLIAKTVNNARKIYESWHDDFILKRRFLSFTVKHGESGKERAKCLHAALKWGEGHNLASGLNILINHFSGEDYHISFFRNVGNYAHSFDTFLLCEFAKYGILHYFLKANEDNHSFISPEQSCHDLQMKIKEDSEYRKKIKESLCQQMKHHLLTKRTHKKTVSFLQN